MNTVFMITSLLGMILLTETSSFAAEIKIGGGGAACSGFFAPAANSYQVETGNVMIVTPSTPGLGLIELNCGIVDIATGAVSLDTMINGAAKEGVPLDPSQFNVIEIGDNRTLVFTHLSNKVKTLSKNQLKDIFTGKLTNWKQLGGQNIEIVVTWGIATPGQNEIFTKQILDGEPVTHKQQHATDYKMIKAFIEKTPGAIGIDPEGFVNGRTNNPETPLVTSKVIAVTKGKPSAEVMKLIQFVKEYAKK